MTRREARAIALERRVTRIDATARDHGHRPDDWTHEELEGVTRAFTRCPKCRLDACVRIESEEKLEVEWEGGKLRWKKCVA